MIVTRKALPRRTFLRGLGATLALPLLDAMTPAGTALAPPARSRVTALRGGRWRNLFARGEWTRSPLNGR